MILAQAYVLIGCIVIALLAIAAADAPEAEG